MADRIDAIVSPDGAVACEVVRDGKAIHRTRKYSGSMPAIDAMKAADQWISKNGSDATPGARRAGGNG